MPVLIVSTPMSVITASACLSMKRAEAGESPCTPSVFCAVNTVMALAPNEPSRVIVLRSAWIPAPPPESEPAIVMTLVASGVFLLLKSRASSFAARAGVGSSEMAEMTASESDPASRASAAFTRLIPPMATSGILTARRTLFKVSRPTNSASSLVLVGKMLPIPM